MGEIYRYKDRPYWLPKGAVPVVAAGEPCEESLQDEYRPSPERLAKVMKELSDMTERERQSYIDDRDVRL